MEVFNKNYEGRNRCRGKEKLSGAISLTDLFHSKHGGRQSVLCHHRHHPQSYLCPPDLGRYHPPKPDNVSPSELPTSVPPTLSLASKTLTPPPSDDVAVSVETARNIHGREIKGAIRALKCYPGYAGFCGDICKVDEGVRRRLKSGVRREKI